MTDTRVVPLELLQYLRDLASVTVEHYRPFVNDKGDRQARMEQAIRVVDKLISQPAKQPSATQVSDGCGPVLVRINLVRDPVNGELHIRQWDNIRGLCEGLHDLYAAPQPHPVVSQKMIAAAEEAYMPFGDMGFALTAALAAMDYDGAEQ